jgi:hypothetical protein
VDNEEARQFVQRFLDIDPDSSTAARAFEALLADYPREWEPLTTEQIADIRRALG